MMRRASSLRSRRPWRRPDSRARLLFNQSSSRWAAVVSRRLDTIRLTLSFNVASSPRALTWIDWVRSPRATALATDAIARTCVVRFFASSLTESVRSFHTPDTPATFAWTPSLPSIPTSWPTRVTSNANVDSWSTIVLMVSFNSSISPWASTVIRLVRSPRATAVVTWEMLRT